MGRLVIQPSAKRDLDDILLHTARESGNREIAAGFVETLRQQCRHLAALPGALGRPRPDLGEGRRSFAHHGYVILFRHEPGILRVLPVIHGHRDIQASLLDPPNGTPPA